MSYFLTSTPPTLTSPLVTSYNLGISWTNVDFALPVPPKIPIVSPEFIFIFIFSKFKLFLSLL